MSSYDTALAAYDRLIATDSEIERKGKSMPYTSLNGHMFSYLSPEGVCGLRLSDADREAFVAQYKTEPFMQHGRVMKEYVTIPSDLLQDTDAMQKVLSQSLSYVRSLKPKAAKKARKK